MDVGTKKEIQTDEEKNTVKDRFDITKLFLLRLKFYLAGNGLYLRPT